MSAFIKIIKSHNQSVTKLSTLYVWRENEGGVCSSKNRKLICCWYCCDYGSLPQLSGHMGNSANITSVVFYKVYGAPALYALMQIDTLLGKRLHECIVLALGHKCSRLSW